MNYCPDCGRAGVQDMRFCPQCGRNLMNRVTPEQPGPYTEGDETFRDGAPENTSGQGSAAILPQAIKGWSWGAFFFGWVWGVFHSAWISLLTLIPYAGFAMSIVLGIKGNEWAWRNKKWDSVEHFKHTQGNWAIAALVVSVISVIIGIVVYI